MLVSERSQVKFLITLFLDRFFRATSATWLKSETCSTLRKAFYHCSYNYFGFDTEGGDSE